jgi:hypothetical protein
MAVAEAEAPADEAEEAEPFRHRKQDLFVKMLHDGITHAFSVSLSDTTVEELERLVKQRLESKQMSWTGNIEFVFQGISYDPRIDGRRILSELGMAKNSTITAMVNHTAVKSEAEAPSIRGQRRLIQNMLKASKEADAGTSKEGTPRTAAEEHEADKRGPSCLHGGGGGSKPHSGQVGGIGPCGICENGSAQAVFYGPD